MYKIKSCVHASTDAISMYKCTDVHTRARVRSRKDPIYINSFNDLTRKLKYKARQSRVAIRLFVNTFILSLIQFIAERIHINDMTKSV